MSRDKMFSVLTGGIQGLETMKSLEEVEKHGAPSSISCIDLSGKRTGISEARMVKMAKCLVRCSTLTQLILPGNQISIHNYPLLGQGLRECKALEFLNLSFNRLERIDELVEDLAPLPAFAALKLTCVGLSNVPDSMIKLTHLRELNLSKNNLTVLNPVVAKMAKLENLILVGNQYLVSPTSFFRWKDYFHALEQNGGCTLDRMKIIVVGDAMAGKTSLIRSIVASYPRQTKPEERTMMLDIYSYVPKASLHHRVVCECYDFGGQDAFRVAQQMFIGEGSRSLFLLVTPLNEDVNEATVESWIHTIASRCEDPRILLVASKVDLCKDVKLCRKRMVDYLHVANRVVNSIAERRIAHQRKVCLGEHCPVRVPVLVEEGVVRFASHGRKVSDLQHLSAALINTMTPSIFPALKEIIPISWRSLLELLVDMKHSNLTIISIKELWEKSSLKCGFKDMNELTAGLLFVHSFGLILYYEGTSFHDIVFLRPQWLANVAKMIFRHDLAELSHVDLRDMVYSAGSVQYQQDLSDLRQCGRLHHRLLGVLLPLRIKELNKELSGMGPSTGEDLGRGEE